MEWYYILGIISYGIFIIQFLISSIGGDVDLDIDFDGNSDFDVSDLLSFKGLIHFIMGFSGWLMITGKVTFINIIFSCIIGFCFVIFLYYIYKLCMKVNSEPTQRIGKDLIGEQVIVYIICEADPSRCLCILNGSTELYCKSNNPVKLNEVRTIIDFENSIYII